MDGERFDRIVRAWHEVRVPRRGVFGAIAAMGGLFTAYRLMFAQPYCIPVGGTCTMFMRCCEGAVCSVGYVNPNVGYCVAGTAGRGLWFAFPGMLTPAVTVTVRPTRGAGRRKRDNRRNRRNQPTRTPTPTTTPKPTRTPDPTRTPVPTATPTLTPTPLPSAFGIEVELVLKCNEVPEKTQIRNVGSAQFTANLMTVPGSGQQPLALGFALNAGDNYTVRTEDPSVDGNSSLVYYPEPSAGRYADIAIGFDQRIAVYRGFCDGSPTELLDLNL
ncbi:MAG: hypothetical protein ACKOWF_01315 [Chloroflexota bacterium]